MDETRDAEPLLRELAAAGVCVATIHDLRSPELDLRPVVSILLRHLSFSYQPGTRRFIAMPLAMSKDLKGMGGAQLIAHLRSERDEQVRSLLAAALAKAALRRDLPDIEELLQENRGVFWGRSELPSALARLEKRAAVPILIDLLNDHPAVAHQAAKALLRLKAVDAAQQVLRWAEGCDATWRDEARGIIRKLKDRGWA